MKIKKSISIILSMLVLWLSACGPENPFAKKKKADAPEAMPDDLDQDQQEPGSYPGVDSTLTNLATIIEQLRLAGLYEKSQRGAGVKIAILDNGFAGLHFALGKRLPPDVHVEEAPIKQPETSEHGAKLAEIVYAVATGSVAYDPKRPGPEILLFNTNGLTNAEYAFNEATARGVDYILYAQSWQFGGNLDGTGFINKFVSRAAKKTNVIVAAGNFGEAAYQGVIKLNNVARTATSSANEAQVALPYKQKYVRLTIKEKQSFAKIFLGWNDFTDDVTYRTKQDLDLRLYTENMQLIGESNLIQDGKPHDVKESAYSAHAREAIATTLEPGTYLLEVVAKSQNFNAKSRLWITAYGPNVSLVDHPNSNSVFIPGDNADVLTVGAADVLSSSYALASWGSTMNKPEIASFSKVSFDDGMTQTGTSTASAITTGALAVLHTGPWGALTMQKIKGLAAGGYLGQQKRKFSLQPTFEVPVLQL